MRRELIEALDYPKSLVLEIIGEGDCPHESLFEVTDKRCQQCDVSRECHWVRCLNDFAEFDGKSTHTINASLRYGINLVETLNGSSPHDKAVCDCEACSWIRGSKRLSEEFDERFATNRYRQVF